MSPDSACFDLREEKSFEKGTLHFFIFDGRPWCPAWPEQFLQTCPYGQKSAIIAYPLTPHCEAFSRILSLFSFWLLGIQITLALVVQSEKFDKRPPTHPISLVPGRKKKKF